MRLKSIGFAVILFIGLSFNAQLKADCKIVLSTLTPFLSATEASHVMLLQSYFTRIKEEIHRTWSEEKFSEKEIAEIHAWAQVPDFADQETTLKIYRAHLEFLLRGLQKRLALTTANQIIAKLDASRILKDTKTNLEKSKSGVKNFLPVEEKAITSIIGNLLLKGESARISESSLIQLLTIKYLLGLHSASSLTEHNLFSNLSILGTAVKENNVKQLQYTLNQMSPLPPGEIRKPKSDESLIGEATALLPGLQNEYEKEKLTGARLEAEIREIAKPLNLVSQEFPGQFIGRLNEFLGDQSYQAGGCCGKGCGSCAYMNTRYLTILQETAKKQKSLPPQVLPVVPPTLVYFQAERDLKEFLPASLFQLHRTPSSYQAALNEIE